MPTQEPPVNKRPVAHVNTLGSGPTIMKRGFVDCPRLGGSVPAHRCLTCREAVSFSFAKAGELASVTCPPEAVARAPSDDECGDEIHLRRALVRDLMSRNVVCVRPDLSLDAAVLLFVETGLKAAPVVDEEGVVLGMVDENDVQLSVHAAVDTKSPGEQLGRLSVSDVMTPMSFAISEHVPATQAAGLLVYESVHRVPVVSMEGQVVGILSASDLLYWLARADGYVLPSPARIAP